jgi:hypothetical protein
VDFDRSVFKSMASVAKAFATNTGPPREIVEFFLVENFTV